MRQDFKIESRNCSICGKSSPQLVPPDLEDGGAPDLDTRPGEPLRSTQPAWLQHCPHCGYAAMDLEVAAEEANALVNSDEYQALSHDVRYPAGALPFLCHAHLLEALSAFPDAGWCSLQAAWLCDDELNAAAAARCRTQAIELWKLGKSHGLSFMDTVAEEFALVADILRRNGDFDEARETCLAALEEPDLPPSIDAILRYQLALISKRDTLAHSMDEISPPPAGAQPVTF
jgi:hypothetical protein